MKKLLVIATLSILAACGPDKVPQDIIDQNMTITRLNAQKNADSWKATVWPEGQVNSQHGGTPMRVLMQSDSTVSPSCRYGDGWASGVLQYSNGKTDKIKCQTNGSGKGINGCMYEAEFVTKSYKDEDGTCNTKIESLEKFK